MTAPAARGTGRRWSFSGCSMRMTQGGAAWTRPPQPRSVRLPGWKTTRSGGRCRGVCRRTARSCSPSWASARARPAARSPERLGLLADLLAVDDAVLDFDTLRREVAARAAADGTISFYAEGHDDLVERATTLARRSPLPSWALAAAKEVLDQAEACKERKAAIVTLHASATGLLDERSNLEDRARRAGPPPFTPPTELADYADWLVRCGEVRESLRAMREDPDTWQPHLDRLKDEAGKIAAAAQRFDQLGKHDLAWARVFQKRQTMVEGAKAGSIISFYQQGWKELVKAARAFGRQQGLPDQARGLVERVLEYDRRLGKERATVDGFFKDAEDHRQRRDPLEEEAKRRARQDPDFLVTDLPGYRSLPDIPKKLLTTGRARSTRTKTPMLPISTKYRMLPISTKYRTAGKNWLPRWSGWRDTVCSTASSR